VLAGLALAAGEEVSAVVRARARLTGVAEGGRAEGAHELRERLRLDGSVGVEEHDPLRPSDRRAEVLGAGLGGGPWVLVVALLVVALLVVVLLMG